MAWAYPELTDWPRDRSRVLVVRQGPPDHADRCFHDLLWWGSGGCVRRHRVQFAVPPTGPTVDDDGTWPD